MCLLTQVQIHKICWSQNDLFFPEGPQLFEDHVCHSEVYSGCPQQPDKTERFKGTFPVCAVVFKLKKK